MERSMENQQKFMALLESALAVQNSTDVVIDTVKNVTSIINNATVLAERSEHPDEVVLDAKVLAVSTNVLTNCVKGIDGNLYAFNTNLYVENILEYISVEDVDGRMRDDWSRLFPIADSCCKKTVSLDYILGTFTPGEREPKKRKERTARQADHKGPAIKPQNVKLGEKQEDGIEDSLQLVMKVLSKLYQRNHKKPICYFKLVVNPESFGATIENIYHVSFLVKDGLVALSLDDNGLPVIMPKTKQPISDADKQKLTFEVQDTNQCIISMSYKDWEEIKELFSITRAYIPHRESPAASTPSTSRKPLQPHN